MNNQRIYKIIFYNQGDIYELHARSISQGALYAFVEVEELIFGERSTLLVDPSEEKLKTEFSGVRRTYIPLQAIVRIDEVEKEGVNKITAGDSNRNNVTPLPVPFPSPGNKPDSG